MSHTADKMRETLSHKRDAKTAWADTWEDMDKLGRDARALSNLTRADDALDTVLGKQTLQRYLPEADERQIERRCKTLFKLRAGPLGELRKADPTLQKTWQALERETALEASLPQVRSVYRAYADQSGTPASSKEFMRDLVSLSNRMNMLRRNDVDPADFLYPAVKLMHERGRNAQSVANDQALVNLLRDLAASGTGNQDGLRARLSAYGASPEFRIPHSPALAQEWASLTVASTSDQPSPSQVSQAMMVEMDRMLDGLAGAARRVLKEELLARAPRWAREVRPGLFQEARTLYNSAQTWSKSALPAAQQGDSLLRAAPDEAVGMLIKQAMDETLGTPSEPAGNRGPLLAPVSIQLGSVASRMDERLQKWEVSEYMSHDQVAALRQELMNEVVAETGIWREIDRLGRKAANHRGDSDNTNVRAPRLATDGIAISEAFQLRHEEIPGLAQRMKRVAENAQRQVANLLTVCKQADIGGSATLPSEKLDALLLAREALAATHGTRGNEIWHGLVDQVMARRTDHELLDLNKGVLQAHIEGRCDLLAAVTDPDIRKNLDRKLHDIWRSIKATSVRREIVPLLKGWCATLSQPTALTNGAQIYRHVNALRGSIDILVFGDARLTPDERRMGADVTRPGGVTAEDMLQAATAELTDAELGALVRALADAPVDLAAPTVRQRLSGYLDEAHHGLDQRHPVSIRDRKIAYDFLEQLQSVSRAQVEKRMNAQADSLVPAFRERLFAEMGRLHTLLGTPQAPSTGEELQAVLGRLIMDAVMQAATMRSGNDADAPTSVRFVGTARGYEVAGALSHALSLDIADLHAQLDTRMKTLNRACFRSDRYITEWRNEAVKSIIQKTRVFKRLEKKVPRTMPRDLGHAGNSRGFSDTIPPRAGSWTSSQFPSYSPSSPTTTYPASPTSTANGFPSTEDLTSFRSSTENLGTPQDNGPSYGTTRFIHKGHIRLDGHIYDNEIPPSSPIGKSDAGDRTDRVFETESLYEEIDPQPQPIRAVAAAGYADSAYDTDSLYEEIDPRPQAAGAANKASSARGRRESGIDTASLTSVDSSGYEVPRLRTSAPTARPASHPYRTSRDVEMAAGPKPDGGVSLDTQVKRNSSRPIWV